MMFQVKSRKGGKHTSIMILLHSLLHVACLGSGDILGLERSALCTHAASSIHRLLENLVFPAENVIGVLSVASAITLRQNEGLGSIRGPDRLVVEWGGVPYDLEHDLRDSDGVG